MWIVVEAVFDDKDEIVQLSEPGCRYEIWYKVGKRDGEGKHILCMDCFYLQTSVRSTSTAVVASIEYMQPIQSY
jgi:hypothetical protein